MPWDPGPSSSFSLLLPPLPSAFLWPFFLVPSQGQAPSSTHSSGMSGALDVSFPPKPFLSWIPFHALCLVTVCGVDKPLHAKVLVGQINSRCPSWRILTSPSGDTVSFLKDGGEFPSFSNKFIDDYSEGTEMDANVNQTCPTLEECSICLVGEMRQVCK